MAESAVLSSGRWVRIRVDSTGIQQITYDQIRAAGFADPSKVSVFGYGGVRLSRSGVSDAVPDDLPQVPVAHSDGKLLFYGEGVMRISVTADGYVSRDRNVHSTAGYYFITDSRPVMYVSGVRYPVAAASGQLLSTHLSCRVIEDDVSLPSRGGTEYFGPDMTQSANSFNVFFDVVDLVENADVDVRYRYAAHSSMSLALEVKFPPSMKVLSQSAGRCAGVTHDEITYYTRSEGSFSFTPVSEARSQRFGIGFRAPGSPSFAAVDYVAVCYERSNDIAGMASMEMFYPAARKGDSVRIDGWTPACRVWAVNDKSEILECPVAAGGMFSVAGGDTDRYYAFDPSLDQHAVTLDPEPVAVQNLHADKVVPEMLIVTSASLAREAEELAGIHASYQNMDVRVVTQDRIFNEFSSGTPHPEAYRRLAQMYYNRDRNRFRYILLYGGGRYDNREALVRDSCSVLTYQCELAQYQNQSTTVFCSDAYFGMLGSDMSDPVYYKACDVAVGRIPVNDSRQAVLANAKIRKYLESAPRVSVPDRALIICDDKDKNSHLEQAEKLVGLISDASQGKVSCTKVYHALYPLDSNNDAAVGRAKIKSTLQDGVGFMCYTGHTNGIYLTGHRIWGIGSITETPVENPPLVMWSTCDAYEFDRSRSDLTQCSVLMPEGGAIGAIGACRTVYQDYNGALMYAVADSLYRSVSEPMLGDVFRRARNGIVNNALNVNDPKLGVNTLCYNYCGDPALPFFNSRYGISPEIAGGRLQTMARNTISGTVMNHGGGVASDFDGVAIVTVYDSPYSRSTYPRGSDNVVSVTLDEEVLAEQSVAVVNGRFSVDMFMPGSMRRGSDMRVGLFAVSHDGLERASGAIRVPVILSDDIPDDMAGARSPEIRSMYIDTPGFEAGDVVNPDCRFFAEVQGGAAGVNMAMLAVGMEPSLRLDGRHTVRLDVSYTDSGDMMLSARLRGLSAGRHTLELSVADNLGNRSSQMMEFLVSDVLEIGLIPDRTIVSDQVVMTVAHALDVEPVGQLMVEDAMGRMVLCHRNVNFPYIWNLTDSNGTRVSDGRYRIYCMFNVNGVPGHTPAVEIAVVSAGGQ